MPIERMPVPGLNALASQPNVLGGLGAGAVRGIMPEEELPGDALEPVVMQDGGLVGEAAMLQNAGRGGDSMLVHMNPEEVGALNQIGNSGIGGLRGYQMTINPQTGLPEMFNFRDLLPTIAGIAVTAMGGAPLVAGLAAGGTSFATQKGEKDLGRAFLAGLGAWGGAELGATLGSGGTGLEASGFTPGTAAVPAASSAELIGQQSLAGVSPITPANMLTEEARIAAEQVGTLQGATSQQMFDAARHAQYASGGLPGGAGRMDMIGKGLENIAGSWTAPPGSDAIGIGELAKPVGASIIGTAGSMPPPEFVPPPPRRRYAYDASGMPDRTFDLENPPEDYVPGVDPEWEYIKDTTPSYDYASGYGLGSLGPPEPYTFLSKHGYRGRGDLPTVNAFLGSESGTVYPQSGGRSRQAPGGWLGGRLSSQIPWDKLTDLSENGTETSARHLTREDEEARLQRISDYYQPGNWRPMQRDRYAFPAQDGTEGETVGEFVDPMPMVPIAVEDRYVPGTYTQPPEGYVPGLDPTHNYFPNRPIIFDEDKDNTYSSRRGGLDPWMRMWSMLLGDEFFDARDGTEGLVVEEAALQQLPTEEAVTTGIMDVAPPAAQDALAERMAVTPSPDQPQNPEEREIFDQALLALQGMLEPEVAEEAIDIFIETFGMDAYSELIALVENKMDEGGIVKPANGETTVAMGDVQGPDMIPGNIVDPMTGEKTANLNVGENEYIEPAPSLARRAMAAGMPPTPENGALVRGAEEDELKAMYG